MRNKFEIIKNQNKALKAKLGIIDDEVSDLDLSNISYSEKDEALE